MGPGSSIIYHYRAINTQLIVFVTLVNGPPPSRSRDVINRRIYGR